jgi:hypothetical protein
MSKDAPVSAVENRHSLRYYKHSGATSVTLFGLDLLSFFVCTLIDDS